jgi:hypothetical protein
MMRKKRVETSNKNISTQLNMDFTAVVFAIVSSTAIRGNRNSDKTGNEKHAPLKRDADKVEWNG